MNIGTSYIELTEEIAMWSARKETIENQVNYLMDKNKPHDICGIDYSMPTGGTNVVLDFEELLVNIAPMQDEVEKIDKLIGKLNESKNIIENKLEKAEGIDYKIIYKRYVEGKNLRIVAKELNYSYAWIRCRATSMK